MKWSDIPFNPPRKALRQFAGLWLVFFLALAAVKGWHGHRQAGLALAALAVLAGVPGLIRPALVRWVFVGWMVLAFPIGWLVSQLALAVLFYGIFTPVGLWFRLRGRDPLGRRSPPKPDSYWTEKRTPEDLRRYFRQY
jgi:hypothetical protein